MNWSFLDAHPGYRIGMGLLVQGIPGLHLTSGSLRALKDPFLANANTSTLRVKGLHVDTMESLISVNGRLVPIIEPFKLIDKAIGPGLQGVELGRTLWRTITALAKTLTRPTISRSNIWHDIFSDEELFFI